MSAGHAPERGEDFGRNLINSTRRARRRGRRVSTDTRPQGIDNGHAASGGCVGSMGLEHSCKKWVPGQPGPGRCPLCGRGFFEGSRGAGWQAIPGCMRQRSSQASLQAPPAHATPDSGVPSPSAPASFFFCHQVMVASALNRKSAGCPEWRPLGDRWTLPDTDAPERRQNRLAGSVVCGRKQVCKLACEIVYSCRPKIARDLCRLSSTAIAVEYISFMSG